MPLKAMQIWHLVIVKYNIPEIDPDLSFFLGLRLLPSITLINLVDRSAD